MYSLQDALQQTKIQLLEQLNTTTVAKVQVYNPETQTVDVQLGVASPDRVTDITGEPPVLTGVPLMFISGGGGLLSFPIKPNDNVLVLFMKEDIDEWVTKNGEVVATDSLSRFRKNSAIAIAGLHTYYNHLQPNPVDVEMKYKGASITIRENGDVDINTPANVNVKAAGDIYAEAGGSATVKAVTEITLDAPTTQVTGNLLVGGTIGSGTGGGSGDCTFNGNIQATGTISSGTVSLDNHTHNENGTGGGVTNPPNPL